MKSANRQMSTSGEFRTADAPDRELPVGFLSDILAVSATATWRKPRRCLPHPNITESAEQVEGGLYHEGHSEHRNRHSEDGHVAKIFIC